MAGTYGIEVEKRIKALRKKVVQIEKLKAKGGEYSPEEAAKIESEKKILADIAALERGEEPAPHIQGEEKPQEPVAEEIQEPQAEDKSTIEDAVPPEEPEAPAPPPAPEISPAEAEKRVKTLKKKLGQIQKLKEKGGTYTKEEMDKIDSEQHLTAEVADLEIGLLDPEPKKNALSLKVKLDQITKLKAKGGPMNLQEKEKVRKEAGIRKELNDILAARVPVQYPDAPKKAPPPKKVKETVPKPEEVVPVIPPEPEYVEYAAPAEEEHHALESDESLAIAQGFAAEENFEEEGFIEAPRRHKKKSAPKEVPPEPSAAAPAPASTPAPASAPASPGPPVVQEQEEPVSVEEVAEAVDEDEWEAAPAGSPPVEESVIAEAAVEETNTPEVSTPVAERPPPVAEPEPSGPPSAEKRIRNLKKKLAQIDKLTSRGGDYTPEEKEKLASQQNIEDEITALENGEPWPPVREEPVPEAAVEEPPVQEEEVAEPPVQEEVEEEPPMPDLTPEEASKKIKALKKKLAQIAKLKERAADNLSPEEAGKVASEPKILGEIAVLESLLA